MKLSAKQLQTLYLATWESVCEELLFEFSDVITVKNKDILADNYIRIFNCVFEISREKGFFSMNMRDLSSATGISVGALYGYFKNKEDLIQMIHFVGLRFFSSIYRSLFDGNSNENELRDYLNFHLILSEDFRAWFRFFYLEIRTLNPRIKKNIIELESLTSKLLEEKLQRYRGGARGTSKKFKLRAFVIKSSLQDYYIKSGKLEKIGVGRKDYLDYLCQLAREC